MENLYNQLNSPIIEFNDKGEQVQRPPTAVMLRAARLIKELDSVNQANNNVINQLRHMVETLTEQLNESLQQNRQQTGDVGNSGTHNSGSNTGNTEGIQTEDSRTSPS